MKKLIVIICSVICFQSLGATYSCSQVGGVEEFTVYVDLAKGKACFFDNDSCESIDLVDVFFSEIMPPETVITFAGNTGASGNIIIRFNKTKLSATVTENIGTDLEATMEADLGCKAEKVIVE